MPVISSSVPPNGRRTSISSSDSGRTTHSRPRALTREPTVKVMTFLQRHADTSLQPDPNHPAPQILSLCTPCLPCTPLAHYPAGGVPRTGDGNHPHRSPRSLSHTGSPDGCDRRQSIFEREKVGYSCAAPGSLTRIFP